MSEVLLVDSLALSIIHDIPHGGHVSVVGALVLHLGRQHIEYAVVQILFVSQKVRGVSVQELLPLTNMFVNMISYCALAVAVEYV